MNRSAREGKSVKRFERPSGPDIALYKNYLLLLNLRSPRDYVVRSFAPVVLP